MEKIMLLFCSLLSCFIVISILFQFMNSNYEKTYNTKHTYIIANGLSVAILTIVNMMNHPILNLLVFILIIGMCARFLYYENNGKAGRRLIECEALAICMGVCEALGVIVLQWILQLLAVKIDDLIILHCLEVTFSKIILIFLYYMTINRLVGKRNFPLSKGQYSVYIIILVYNFINLLLIVWEFMQKDTHYLWAANMGCIVLADLYLLYFIKISNEKNYYENQVKALEQQANIQYRYYCLQTENYDAMLKILHDVNKHIKVIEDLFAAGKGKTAAKYTWQINDMLSPLIPTRYTGHPILDILLTDKVINMKEKGIDFQANIENVDLKCIEPIDVTTIFGNLLDNAVEASENSGGHKYVFIKIGSYHQMISIKLENNSNYVRWKNGMPISEKGAGRGLGLLNVQRSIAKYEGDLKMKWKDDRFTVEMFLNI
ncbi:MAG: GHKL domain-containing protein [Lachnospiraceae bacterium]|nr:GHKL domain-containing protein [Lachnospiraceae bacterium]